MSKKKKNKKKKKNSSSKKGKKSKSALNMSLTLAVQTGQGWEKLFSTKVSKSKPVREQKFDMFFDVSDTVMDFIKDGARLKKSLKIKMVLGKGGKSNAKKKKSAKKKVAKKKISSSINSKAKSKPTKVSPTKAKPSKAKPTSRVKTAKKKITPPIKAKRVSKTAAKPKVTPKSKKSATVRKAGSPKRTSTSKKTIATRKGRKPARARAKKDDLKKIKGIGLKMEKILNRKGIKTYAELSKVGVKALQDIINSAGGYYQSYKPQMWKSEAALAKAGKFDKMQTGRR